jgi:hypothetical protein
MQTTASNALKSAEPASPAVTLQRSCACESTSESCPRCSAKRGPLQRLAAGSGMPLAVPGSVGDVLRTTGQPLPIATREEMGGRFGHDFSNVRIHADAAARSSAAAMHARAYTVGQHVVLGGSAPDLASTAGRRLLGHELAHVVQQSRGGVANGTDPDPGLEAEADQAGAQIAAGRAARIRGPAPIGIQRAAEESDHPDTEKIAAYAVRMLGMGEGASRVVAASLEGGFAGFSHEWGEGGTGERVGKKVKGFSAWNIPELVQGYVVGVLEGVVSPITDLFAIGVMVEQLNDFAMKLASSAMSRAAELVQDLNGVVASLVQSVGPIKHFLLGLRQNPRETFKMLMGVIGSNGSLADRAVGLARSVGRSQGAALAKSFESPWENKKEPDEAPVGLLSWTSNLAGKGRDALIEGPWAKIGNKAGYALGFAAIQVVLLVFSEGIGNLITQIGRSLGGVAKAGSFLGKTIEGVAKFISAAGSIITKAEEAVNAVVSLLMKPLMPVLEPLLKPVANVMERLGGFLRKLLGIAEKDAAQVATTVVAKTIGSEHPPALHVPGSGTPGPHAPTAHPPGAMPHGEPPVAKPTVKPHPPAKAATEPHPAAKPTAEPHPAAKAASDTAPAAKPAPEAHPASKPASEPHPHSQTPPANKPGDPHAKTPHPASDAAHKPLAEPEHVGGGHHTQVTPDGIELCSPPPCPNLRLVYKRQLAASDELRKEMERLEAMRKIAARLEAQGTPDPALAKRTSKEAAQLQKKLEAAKLGKPQPSFAPQPRRPVGPPVGKPRPPLQTGPYSSGQNPVAGHHVHQSASMSPRKMKSATGNPNHGKAVAIKQNVPGFTEAQHGRASATQRNINRAMHGEPHEAKIGDLEITATGDGKTVSPSLDFEDVKAYHALRAAGRSQEEALELVMRSRDQIEAAETQIVRVPTR